MPLKRKHLDALRIANLPFKEIFHEGERSDFITIQNENIVDTIEYLHDNFPEDKPIIPLKIEADHYWLYIHKENNK